MARAASTYKPIHVSVHGVTFSTDLVAYKSGAVDFYLGPLDEIPLDVDIDLDEESASWLEHLVKGMASLGLLSFIRVAFTMSPWWGARSIAGGRSTSGRDRVRSLNWLFVLMGILSFLWVCS